MDTREYLSRAYMLKQSIDSKHNQIMELQSMAERAKSYISDKRSAGTECRRKLEDALSKLNEVKGELSSLIDSYTKSYREIIATINAVENPSAMSMWFTDCTLPRYRRWRWGRGQTR